MAFQLFFLILGLTSWEGLFGVHLNKELDINTPNELGLAQLHVATKNGNYFIAKTLLQNGAEVNCITSGNFYKKWTPLFWAVHNNDSCIVETLLEYGARVDIADELGQTPLHLACKNSNIDIIKKLLARGARIDFQDQNEKNALHFALLKGNIQVIQTLLCRCSFLPRKIDRSRASLTQLCLYELAFFHNPEDYTQLPPELIERILHIIHPSTKIIRNHEVSKLKYEEENTQDYPHLVVMALCERHLAKVKNVMKHTKLPSKNELTFDRAYFNKVFSLLKTVATAASFKDLNVFMQLSIQEAIKKFWKMNEA